MVINLKILNYFVLLLIKKILDNLTYSLIQFKIHGYYTEKTYDMSMSYHHHGHHPGSHGPALPPHISVSL